MSLPARRTREGGAPQCGGIAGPYWVETYAKQEMEQRHAAAARERLAREAARAAHAHRASVEAEAPAGGPTAWQRLQWRLTWAWAWAWAP